MWILKKLDGEVYPLYAKPEHIIGRFGNLELSSDASVSRRHASIHITLKKGVAKLILRDLGSKYGTYLNEGITSMKAMSKSTPTELKIGDRIRFGMQANIWILEESRFIVCTSMLSSQDKPTLKSIIATLKGEIICDWSATCSHLTMTHIKTTVKAICALAQVKPIVTLEYWKHLAAAFAKSTETALPDCDDFVPPIAEPQLKLPNVSMKMNRKRRIVFQDFKFITFGQVQLNNVSLIVEAAGGTVVDGDGIEICKNELCQEKVIVIQNNSDKASSSNVLRASNILNSNNLRSIKETEIYLSIVECSTEKFCNPRYDASILFRLPESQISVKDESTILVPETEDTLPEEDTQFLETASGNFSLNVNDRIVFSESEDEDIIADSDPSIISNTPTDFRSTTKRKILNDVDCIKTKNARIDNWLLNKKNATKDTSESSASESIFSSSTKTNKKDFKDLFNFRVPKKDSDKASSSLFSTNIDSSPQSNSVSKDKASKGLRSSTLFATANPKSSESGDEKISRTAKLFVNVNASRTTRSSGNLFSKGDEPSVQRNSPLGKRKRDDERDSETKSSSRAVELFERQMKRPHTIHESVIIDSDDESDLIANKTSKLAIANDVPISHDSPPVDIPSKMSLSQFQSPSAKENIMHIKKEENSPVQDTSVNKSVVYTVPLVQSNVQNMQPKPTDHSVVNFKKFRKNCVCYPSSTGLNSTKLVLFSNAMENGFHDD